MQKVYSRVIRVTAFFLVFVLLFSAASRILSDKMSYKYTADYYNSDDDYEVLFFGSSHMMDGVLPLELYRRTGVISYNLGMTGENFRTTYWRIREALERKKPKVIVVDVYGLTNEVKRPQTESDLAYLHNSLDNMPLSMTKLRALQDLFGPLALEDIFNYLFPISLYHGRYRDLTEDDFNTYVLEDKGALPLRGLFVGAQPFASLPQGQTAQPEQSGGESLEQIIALCERYQISVLLTAIPFAASEQERQVLNGAVEFAARYDNVAFANLFYEDVVDPAIDFSDADGHLNISGAARLTRWLGEFLTRNYTLTDRRGDAAYAHWAQSDRISLKQHLNRLGGAPDVNTALMLLAQDGVGYRVSLAPQHLQSAETVLLLQRLGIELRADEGEAERLIWQTGPCPQEQSEELGPEQSRITAWDAETCEWQTAVDF